MEFGKILRKIREEKGVTQEELAKALGYKNNSYIARVERGDFLPSKENLKKIVSVLKISFRELDSLVFEAKIKELGIKKPELLALFKDILYLPEKDKKAIINAYLKVKEKLKRIIEKATRSVKNMA
ncbi:MAG: helix-turn-helix domain-containing protein [Nitrososphaeria archaeon]